MLRADTTRTLSGLVLTLVSLSLVPAIAGAAAEEMATATSPPAEKPSFDVLEYRVLGNSVLPPRDVEAAVYQYLGPGKTLDDVELARQSLENEYRAAGR